MIFHHIVKRLNYNGICVLCRQNSGHSRDLCHQCEGDLPFLHPIQVVCKCCGLALNTLKVATSSNQSTLICGECQQQPPHFHQTIALMEYGHPVNRMIQALKLHQGFQFLNVLCTLFSDYLAEHYHHNKKPEAFIPVPLHHSKLSERGFNQSHMMAKKLSRPLSIPTLNNTCQRHGNAERQSGLQAQQRRQNLSGAFQLTYQGRMKIQTIKHVAIIDDVMTTGSTANELAKTLIDGGVEQVDVLVLARTGPR